MRLWLYSVSLSGFYPDLRPLDNNQPVSRSSTFSEPLKPFSSSSSFSSSDLQQPLQQGADGARSLLHLSNEGLTRNYTAKEEFSFKSLETSTEIPSKISGNNKTRLDEEVKPKRGVKRLVELFEDGSKPQKQACNTSTSNYLNKNFCN